MLAIINGSFSLLLLGQFVSQLGDAAYMVGLPWAVYAVTGDFLKVAGVTSVATVTRLLAGWLGGAVADRFSRKFLLCLSDFIRAAAALAVGVWLQGRGGSIWPLYLLAFFFGAAGSVFAPTLFAAIPEVVGEENVFRANSVFTIGSQLTVIGGPVLGGLILSRFGAAWVFLFDGLTFLVAAVFVLFIRFQAKKETSQAGENLFYEAVRGFRYLWRTPWLRRLAGVSTVSNALTDAPWTVLLPAFIAKVLKVDSASYGIILSVMGLGTIVTSAGILPRKPLATEKAYYAAVAMGGIVFGLIGLAWSLPAMLVLGFAIGCAVAVTRIVSATAMQTRVDPAYLGRVHSLLSTVQMALLPFMYNLYGRLGETVSLRLLFGVSGLVILNAALVGLWKTGRHKFHVT